ncbi:oxidoreductase [Jiangella anatolica]|uniref:Oxidoreductase n=1 Tax=Jiangella anatolica TaxID=2670374 RepID=A0A2W2AXJ6_9ACTN|nr:oxidoreductase [Jiangella anatolica]PZF79911.1 oxidoreductase [Jiangella anatolica]
MTGDALFDDDFTAPVPLGMAIGSAAPGGRQRGGVDVEGVVGVDNGALRIRPLDRPGWGRSGVAYDPVERRPGRVLGVHVLNGHHSSQTYYDAESLKRKLRRWAGNVVKRRTVKPRPQHYENLAAGFFAGPATRRPLAGGHGLVVHAATGDNGELWLAHGSRPLISLRGVLNTPLAFYVLLRPHGAVYYAATLEGDSLLPALPSVRPLAIDPHTARGPLWPAVQQRILGEVGYRVDTRVFRLGVADVPELAEWYTTAHACDPLTGAGPLAAEPAVRGGEWRVLTGSATRTAGGLRAGADGVLARLDPDEPAGLVHVLVRTGLRPSPVRLGWRAGDGGRWELRLGAGGAWLDRVEGAGRTTVASSRRPVLRPAHTHSVQLSDDGTEFSLYVDGRRLFGRSFADSRDGDRAGLVVGVDGPGSRLRELEAHPRAVAAPGWPEPSWPAVPAPGDVVFDDTFDGLPDGVALAGWRTAAGEWERTEGKGQLLAASGGVQVDADVDRPNPGRTLHTVAWPEPGYTDLTVTMTPPGTARGQGHEGRCGLVLWQDDENYVIVNLWLANHFQGGSLSSFYRIGGHEDMYDAVWTLTADMFRWGDPCTLNLRFDGERLVASIDGRPTLYRAITDVYPDAGRLTVNRVGLVANEEWGDDTGTVFHRFTARGRLSGG